MINDGNLSYLTSSDTAPLYKVEMVGIGAITEYTNHWNVIDLLL